MLKQFFFETQVGDWLLSWFERVSGCTLVEIESSEAESA